MVKGAKKKFIDRKNAVTFHLVHRSQHDPLIADENAPQHVLVEAAKNPKDTQPASKQEELKKFGIFYDDDYDYLQHLKEPNQNVVWEYVENPNHPRKEGNKPKLQLPSSVFESEFEEDEGMLNKAAPRTGPRPDLDPDIVAAWDDDFDFDNPDNQLEDDFVLKAMDGDDDDFYDENEEFDEEEEEEDEEDGSFDSDGPIVSDIENDEELMDRLGPLMREKRFDNEETKSRFTEYSMSSSVIRRNEQLSLLDDKFEKFYASYDDPEVGPLDMEDIEGHWGQKHPFILNCFKEFKHGKKSIEYDRKWDDVRIEKYREIKSDDDDEMVEMEVDSPQKKWDCESILSTYSDIYNHPKLITEPKKSRKIQIDPKTGLPSNVFRGGDADKLTTKTLAKFDNENAMAASNAEASGPKSLCAKSVMSTLSVLSIRPKDETQEEKKERKRLLKEYRAERRMERKANSEAFKEEKKRQTHIKINQQHNIQGNRIL